MYDNNQIYQRQNFQAIKNNQLLFFKPYRSINELANHVFAHSMVLSLLLFLWIFPIIALSIPLIWFFLCMRNQVDIANNIMHNFTHKIMGDIMQLFTIPYRCVSTLLLGFAENNSQLHKQDSPNLIKNGVDQQK